MKGAGDEVEIDAKLYANSRQSSLLVTIISKESSKNLPILIFSNTMCYFHMRHYLTMLSRAGVLRCRKYRKCMADHALVQDAQRKERTPGGAGVVSLGIIEDHLVGGCAGSATIFEEIEIKKSLIFLLVR